MSDLYLLFKFVHVAAAVFWIGGVTAVNVTLLRLAAAQDPAAIVALARHFRFYGAAVIGPAALLTLAAGIAAAARVGLDFGTFWISWGFIAFLGFFLLGVIFVRRFTAQLVTLAPTAKPGDARLMTLRRRMTIVNAVSALLLLSAVWAMVFKPTL